jgi:hypothetical protein
VITYKKIKQKKEFKGFELGMDGNAWGGAPWNILYNH